jgi:tRNA dimethylallyltransferase
MDNENVLKKKNCMKPLLVVTGPTASGKSAFAIKLAEEIKGEIISADSAQIYKNLSIITARTKETEMMGIPHHLSGFIDLNVEFSLADYQKAAYDTISEIYDRGNIPIMVGGTILYIKAVSLAYNLPDIPPAPDFRKFLIDIVTSDGNEVLYKMLMEKDPEAAERIHPNNLPRVIRALEVIEKSGKKFSDFYTQITPHPLGVKPYYIWMDIPREELYQRIDKRVDDMIEEGAIKEIDSLLKAGYEEIFLKLKIMGTLEIINILRGKLTLKEGIEQIKRNTRRYAKRQITWLRTFGEICKVPVLSGDNQFWVNKIKKELSEIFHCYRTMEISSDK